MNSLGIELGKVGSATKYVDDQKEELCIGDVVLVSSDKIIEVSCIICTPEDTPTIMGIDSACNHETGEVRKDCKIHKLFSGKDLHGVILIGSIPVTYE